MYFSNSFCCRCFVFRSSIIIDISRKSKNILIPTEKKIIAFPPPSLEEKVPLSASSPAVPPYPHHPPPAFTDDLPTSLVNPNAKFDFFRDDDDGGESEEDFRRHRHRRSQHQGYGYEDEEEEEEEEEDESGLPSYR